jgi:hypothetical protein
MDTNITPQNGLFCVYFKVVTSQQTACVPPTMSLSLSVLSVFLSFFLSVILSLCLSVILFFCLPVFLSFCLSVFLSFCLSVFLNSATYVYFSILLGLEDLQLDHQQQLPFLLFAQQREESPPMLKVSNSQH